MARGIVGIDIGTSSCSVAMMVGGRPQVLPIFDGHDEMPTYVAFTSQGDRLVGWSAKRQAVLNPQNTIFTIKRLIGRKYTEAAAHTDLGLLPYKVVPSAAGGLWVEAGGRSYTPTEITAIMLAEVRNAIESSLGNSVGTAVITVPAYFDLSQIQATVDAAEIAGLEVSRVLAEPTAAALAYGFEQKKQKGITAVYDLGGGTFDVSLLEIGDGVFEVKAVNGDNRFGGEDFDHLLVGHFIKQIQRDHAVDLSGDPLALHRLKDAAEQIKVQLDVLESVAFPLPYLPGRKGTLFNAVLKLTRSEIESLFLPLIERTLRPCQQAMREAGLDRKEVDNIVLVGGMSRMPAIRRSVAEFFGCTPKLQLDPCRVVAYGAAIQASTFAGDMKDVLLLDVTPFPLGVEDHDGKFVEIIQGNTTIPTNRSVTFKEENTTVHRQMSRMIVIVDQAIDVPQGKFEQFVKVLKVLQKGTVWAADRESPVVLAEVTTDFPSFMGSKERAIQVIIHIDANATASVCVIDLRPGGKQISQRLRAVNPYDRRGQFSREELAARRAEADQLLNAVSQQIDNQCEEIPGAVLAQIKQAKLGLERAIQSRDVVELQGATDVLASLLGRASERIAPVPLPAAVEVQAAPCGRTVFVSYAREDAEWLERLRTHLKPLEMYQQIEIWFDGKLNAGGDWRLDINRVLDRASSIVLLITANFLASSFIYENELPPILRRRRAEGLQVYPLIVTNSCYARIPELASLGAFNDPKIPLSAMTETEVDAQLARLAAELWDKA